MVSKKPAGIGEGFKVKATAAAAGGPIGGAVAGSAPEQGTFQVQEGLETKSFFIHRVTDKHTLNNSWEPQLHDYFPDKTDWESREELEGRLKDKKRNYFIVVGDEEAKPAGMMLLQTDPAKSLKMASYIPWAGVAPQYRNGKVFPTLLEKVKEQMGPAGIDYVLFEAEDPKRIHVAYDEKPGGLASKMAARRVDFYQRDVGAIFINDTDIPYIRPASDNDQNIQAYDLLAIKVLNADSPALKGKISEDGTMLAKSAYREFYLQTTRLQYGNLSEKKLRETLPAVDQFLTTCDNSPKQWVSLKPNDFRPRSETRFKAKLLGNVGGMQPHPEPVEELTPS